MDKTSKTYIGLVKELALTDFKLKYQGSILGYLWSLVKPIMTFLVLLFVFTNIFRVGKSIEHYPVYLLLGIVIWGFFTEITSTSIVSIVSKGELIRKIYFPRIVLVISQSITGLITFLLNFLVVIVFLFFSGIFLNVSVVFVPLLILELFVLTIGVSLILSSLFVRFRDISHIWEILMMAAFYATPILYPLSLVPPRLAKLMMLNPMAQIIQDTRYVLVTHQTDTAWKMLDWHYVWIPYLLPFVILVSGYWFFQKSAAKFAEEV